MDGALDDPGAALGDAKAVVVASEEDIKDYFQELERMAKSSRVDICWSKFGTRTT